MSRNTAKVALEIKVRLAARFYVEVIYNFRCEASSKRFPAETNGTESLRSPSTSRRTWRRTT